MLAGGLADGFGPELVLEFNRGASGPSGVVVIDNTRLGPAKGGLRLAEAVSVEELVHLARLCTYRNAIMELPFGGGRAAIRCQMNEVTQSERETVLRLFARVLKTTSRRKYIAEPDIQTGARDMRIIAEELGYWSACAGKPSDYHTKAGRKSGIPHIPQITALGLFYAVTTAASHLGLPLDGMRVSLAGLGEVTPALATKLKETGAQLISAPESLPLSEVLRTEEDLLVLGRIPGTATEKEINTTRVKIVVEGEDMVLTQSLKERLSNRGAVVLPDLISNCGRAIASFCELKGIEESLLPLTIERKAVKATIEVLQRADLQGISPYEAAVRVAESKLSDRR